MCNMHRPVYGYMELILQMTNGGRGMAESKVYCLDFGSPMAMQLFTWFARVFYATMLLYGLQK